MNNVVYEDLIIDGNDYGYYSSFNKQYIPEEYMNPNFEYHMNGDYITIITNNNCNNQYNQTYCNCLKYNFKTNVLSEIYTCSTNNNDPKIPYSTITNNINESSVIREKFYQDKTKIMGIVIIALLFAILLTKERKSL